MLPITHSLTNYARRTVTSGIAATLLVVCAAGTADASAVGYAKVSGFCFTAKDQQICLPTISLGHFIKGGGRTITRQEASVQDTLGADSTGLQWCNWRIDWRYADTSGRTYQVSRGATHPSCTWGGSIGRVDRSRRTLKHYGKACADFFVTGKRRATQCHYVTK
ncbi:hypothetical protein ACFVTY_34005 [Streptomyces sp. NPDC058067]|uniref:hypothetical protein n=1 Tax=Streptomyces sp. NPDC058067 TaxID=3346324 RepID=UPI0036E90239